MPLDIIICTEMQCRRREEQMVQMVTRPRYVSSECMDVLSGRKV